MKPFPIIIIFLAPFTLISCKEEVNKNKFENIILDDRFSNKLYPENSDSITVAEYSPLFIGKYSPKINLSYLYYKTIEKFTFVKEDKYKLPKKDSIKIFVDTTRTIGTPMGLYGYSHIEKRNDKIAFPIFMENVSQDTVQIGYAGYLPLLIEAKDQKGNWKPIQKTLRFECGTGIFGFYLSPNNMLVSSIKIYDGNFNTKLRLVYELSNEKIYSNEVNGKINSNQFENETSHNRR